MMRNYMIDRLTEASTWRGIVLLVTAIGVPVAPDLADAIVTAGLGAAGLVGILTRD